MSEVHKVTSVSSQLQDTPNETMPHKKNTERAKNNKKVNFSDIYEIRQLSSEFNRASLASSTENVSAVRDTMNDLINGVEFTGMFIIKDISYSQQLYARQLLGN